MPLPGMDYLPPVRSFRDFFGRYGTTTGSIRGVWNGILPVAVVDKYRDDTEGSIFGMTATAQATANRFAAFVFGSPSDDWELLGAAWGFFLPVGAPAVDHQFNLMMYMPDATYNPVQTPAPAGLFVPGLTPDFNFTLGSVQGIAGHNATLPGRFGFFPFQTLTLRALATPARTIVQDKFTPFDPPTRVYRDISLGFVMTETVTVALDVTLSLLYRIRPRTTDGPRTA